MFCRAVLTFGISPDSLSIPMLASEDEPAPPVSPKRYPRTCFGFKGHLLVNDEGLIQSLLLTPGNVDDRAPLLGLSATIRGVLIGDKGYIDLQKWQWLWQLGVQLKTPIRKNMAPRPAATASRGQKRRRKIVETVISQLEQRFNIGTVKARDSWHLINRITRKVLAHTILCAFNYILDREPLHHDGLVAIS